MARNTKVKSRKDVDQSSAAKINVLELPRYLRLQTVEEWVDSTEDRSASSKTIDAVEITAIRACISAGDRVWYRRGRKGCYEHVFEAERISSAWRSWYQSVRRDDDDDDEDEGSGRYYGQKRKAVDRLRQRGEGEVLVDYSSLSAVVPSGKSTDAERRIEELTLRMCEVLGLKAVEMVWFDVDKRTQRNEVRFPTLLVELACVMTSDDTQPKAGARSLAAYKNLNALLIGAGKGAEGKSIKKRSQRAEKSA